MVWVKKVTHPAEPVFPVPPDGGRWIAYRHLPYTTVKGLVSKPQFGLPDQFFLFMDDLLVGFCFIVL
jgi:hypothetical protein